MAELATWRSRPDDPHTPLGMLIGVDRWQGVPIYPLAVGWVAVAIVVRSAIEGLLPKGAGDALGPVVSSVILTAPVLGIAAKDRNDLAPDPAPPGTHRGSVKIRLGERDLGDDRGMLALSDGWLVFEGGQTAFAISPADVTRVFRVAEERRLELSSGHRLRLTGDLKFREDLDRWLASPSPIGLSRLPPRDAHPTKRLRAASLLQLVGASMLGGSIGLALTFLPGSIHSLSVLWLIGIAAVAATLCHVLARDRARRFPRSRTNHNRSG